MQRLPALDSADGSASTLMVYIYEYKTKKAKISDTSLSLFVFIFPIFERVDVGKSSGKVFYFDVAPH